MDQLHPPRAIHKSRIRYRNPKIKIQPSSDATLSSTTIPLCFISVKYTNSFFLAQIPDLGSWYLALEEPLRTLFYWRFPHGTASHACMSHPGTASSRGSEKAKYVTFLLPYPRPHLGRRRYCHCYMLKHPTNSISYPDESLDFILVVNAMRKEVVSARIMNSYILLVIVVSRKNTDPADFGRPEWKQSRYQGGKTLEWRSKMQVLYSAWSSCIFLGEPLSTELGHPFHSKEATKHLARTTLHHASN